MNKKIYIIASLIFTTLTAHGHNAHRDLNTDFSHYEKDYLRSVIEMNSSSAGGKSALRSAKKFGPTFETNINRWASVKIMQDRFEKIRDSKLLIWRSKPNAPRRISWLYPDDGCWTRAAMVMKISFQEFYPLPNKIFAFGNLRVKTKNSPRGVVGWWYHVAPIVQVGKESYVLDPSIEYSRPLTMNEWLSRMGKPEKMKVAICSSGTYSPGDTCEKVTNGLEINAQAVQQHFLGNEYKRLSALGRLNEL